MYTKFYRYFAGSYFQLIPLTIIIQACISSMVVFFLLQRQPTLGDMIQLLICLAATTLYLGAILGQLHVKKVCSLFLISLVVNIALLACQLIS